jgi:hypothetical protein
MPEELCAHSAILHRRFMLSSDKHVIGPSKVQCAEFCSLHLNYVDFVGTIPSS